MIEGYIFRRATIDDVGFLAEAIIEAEKSGTDILSYTTVFGLSEKETKSLIIEMLKEEIDGCDLSVSSFLVAEKDGEVIAALSIWLEGLSGISSTILKGNLLSCHLSEKALDNAKKVIHITSELSIEPISGSLSIGAGYVHPKHRGKGLLRRLTELHIEDAMKIDPPPKEIYTQIFSNNTPAIKTNEKLGFKTIAVYHAKTESIARLLPSNKKILMMRILK